MLSDEILLATANQGFHMSSGELRMELSGKCMTPIPHNLMWIVSRLGQSHRTCWQGDYRLHMSEVSRKLLWPVAENFVAPSRRKEVDRFTPHLPPLRVIVNHAAKRMGHQLVPVAHTGHRHLDAHSFANPASYIFAPGLSVGNHCPRAGDNCHAVRPTERKLLALKCPNELDVRG